MSALAGYLRDRALEDVRQLSATERIRLALALGEDDLRMLCASSGLDTTEAQRQLVATRQIGRRFSASASKP